MMERMVPGSPEPEKCRAIQVIIRNWNYAI